MNIVEMFYRLSFPMIRNKTLNRVLSQWNKLMRFLLRKVYPIYCRLMPLEKVYDKNKRGSQTDLKLIVSLTSFPARMKTIEWTLQSICRQTIRPDKVLLWLTKEEYHDIEVPEQIKYFQRYGIQICMSEENLKPHNKSFFTAREYKDFIIVTLDDDLLYSERVIERLYTQYLMSDGHTVICEQAHGITFNKDGKVKMYNEWDWEAIGKKGPSMLLMAKGSGGVLYPPGFFRDRYFNVEQIRKNCLMADDLWLKFIGLENGYRVQKTRKYARWTYTCEGSQIVALGKKNNGDNRNNQYLGNLLNLFDSIDWADLLCQEELE